MIRASTDAGAASEVVAESSSLQEIPEGMSFEEVRGAEARVSQQVLMPRRRLPGST